MRMPAFWGENRGGLIAWLLAPLGWLYGVLTLARLHRPGWRAPVPVICIGNFTIGGAGKTPSAIALAKALITRGETPFFLSRGYRGHAHGPLRVDTARHDARHVGDEPLLLARIAPTIIARDRAAGAWLAIEQGASLLILDDGMQSPALSKDMTIGVVDGGFGLGNGLTIPAGPLRAPFRAMRKRVDAILVIGEGTPALTRRVDSLGAPVFATHFTLEAEAQARVSNHAVMAFAGIGRPEKFFETLRQAGANLVGQRPFADHHPFSDAEALELMRAADAAGAQLVTTEKDYVRLKGSPVQDRLAESALPIPVTLTLPDELIEKVQDALRSWRSRSITASGPA